MLATAAGGWFTSLDTIEPSFHGKKKLFAAWKERNPSTHVPLSITIPRALWTVPCWHVGKHLAFPGSTSPIT
jgi:hypothetical protein